MDNPHKTMHSHSHLAHRFRNPVTRLGTCLLLTAAPALAQGTLVADLNTTPPSAEFDGQVQVRGEALGSLWLSASRPGYESPVWRLTSPGAAPEPFPLPFVGPQLANDAELLEVAQFGGLALLAVTESNGRRVYATDGTPAGTLQLPVELYPTNSQSFNSDTVNFQSVGNRAYFLGTAPETGRALFETDGTVSGTRAVAELNVGPASDFHRGFSLANGRAIVQTSNAAAALYAFNLANGSVEVLFDNSINQGYFDPLQVGGKVVFSWDGDSANQGTEPWVTDGTPAGTQPLGDLSPGAFGSFPGFLAATSTQAYFTATTPAEGRELWTTDGTAAGTRLVIDLAPGNLWGVQGGAAFAGARLVFAGSTDGVEREPWSTDGTAAGTALLGEVQPGPLGSDPEGFRSVLGGVAFSARNAAGREPVFTLGTVTIVTSLGDVEPGPASSFPGGFTGYGGSIVFSAETHLGRELWAGPVSGGSSLLANVGIAAGNAASSPAKFTTVAGRAYFKANGTDGEGLYVTAGAPDTTTLLTLDNDLQFEPLGALDTGLVFQRRNTGAGREPWYTDGTVAGTIALGDLLTGGSSQPTPGGQLGERYYFVADSDGQGRELWSTDGTPGGTQLSVELQPGPESGIRSPNQFIVLDEQLLMLMPILPLTSPGPFADREMWVTDGTQVNTAKLAQGLLGGLDVLQMIPYGDRVALMAIENTVPATLRVFVTDGSDAGTSELTTVPGISFAQLGAVGERLVVITQQRVVGIEPNGTTTTLLAPPLTQGAANFAQFSEGLGDTNLTFRVSAGDSDVQGLWSTDGTVAGTLRVSDQLGPLRAAGDGGEFVFRRSSDAEGSELWLGDETGAIQLLADVHPGSLSSSPRPLGRVGNRLLFSAFTEANGRELHAVSLGSTGGYVSDAFGQGCGAVGRPDLDLAGEVRLGNATTLVVDDAGTLAPVIVYASGVTTELPLGACTVYLGPRVPIGSAIADLDGQARLDLAIPSQSFWLGAELYLQAAVVQLGGPALGTLGLSNALELVLGN